MITKFSVQDLEKKFSEDWPKNSENVSFCHQILEYLSSKKFEDVQHLTIQSFLNFLTPPPSDNDLLDILRYLNGTRIELLTTNFELIDDHQESYVLSPEDVRYLRSTGNLIHPETGLKVKSPQSKVYMFFSPSPKMRSIQQSK